MFKFNAAVGLASLDMTGLNHTHCEQLHPLLSLPMFEVSLVLNLAWPHPVKPTNCIRVAKCKTLPLMTFIRKKICTVHLLLCLRVY